MMRCALILMLALPVGAQAADIDCVIDLACVAESGCAMPTGDGVFYVNQNGEDWVVQMEGVDIPARDVSAEGSDVLSLLLLGDPDGAGVLTIYPEDRDLMTFHNATSGNSAAVTVIGNCFSDGE